MRPTTSTWLLLAALASSSSTSAQVAIPLQPRALRDGSLRPRSDPTVLHAVDWQQIEAISARVAAKYGHPGDEGAAIRRRDRDRGLPAETEVVRRALFADDELDPTDVDDDLTYDSDDDEEDEEAEEESQEIDDEGGDASDDWTIYSNARRSLRHGKHDHRRRHQRHSHGRRRRGKARVTKRKPTTSAPKPTSTKASTKRASSSTKKASSKTIKNLTAATPVPLSDDVVADMDIEIFGAVAVGTPPQVFQFDMDTGSADTWVMAKTCSSSCGTHTRYKTTASSTFKDLKKLFRGTYIAGGVKGQLVQDAMSVGGLSVPKQAFGAASQVSSDWTSDPANGMFGLAFQTIASSGQAPWFANYIQTAKLSPPQQRFSFAIGRFKSGSTKASELFIGGVNPSKYTGNFSYVPLSVQSFWQVTASAVYVASSPNAVSIFTPAIFDTGTSYIVAPSAQADAFWAAVPGSAYVAGTGQYTYPCNQTIGMSVSFAGQDQRYTVNELDMNLGLAAVGSSRCVGAVFGGETGGNWIFGLTFLKSYYTTFDVAGSQVGFATPTY